MKRKCILLLVAIFNIVNVLYAQQLTQTVKGKVTDVDSEIGLPGATVVILGTNPIMGTVTDAEGNFRIENVPIGRVSLKISYIGYELQYIHNIMLSSGKELNLNIALKESVKVLNEVVVKPDIEKDKPLNEMATLSARTVTVDEAQRFAGSMEDPSRLVSTYAGITPSSVDNNEIVIRGNAAKGILWRIEGVAIPAPNHLAGMFSGGGFNTMFSSNMLANSDFLTSAFPAEYGNAISGVFDMRLRRGNQDKREYAFQVGSQGIEAGLEGPFAKGKGSTYLVNFRYSTIGLLQGLMPQITGLPAYMDLSMNMNFPTRKVGTFTFWSINGTGSIASNMSKDTATWETNMDSFQYDIGYSLTASGINNRYILDRKTYLFTSLSYSGTKYTNHNDYYRLDLQEVPVTNQKEINSRLSLTSYINHKFGRKHTNKTGIVMSQLMYNFNVANNTDVAEQDTANFFVDSKGSTFSFQAYTESKIYLRRNLDINAGLHFTYVMMNKEFIIEPRLGIRWRFRPGQSLSFAYGKHSRMEPLRIYLTEIPVNGSFEKLNESLKITKAHHFVVGYDVRLWKETHLNIEAYYQKLYDVPIIPDSTFSMLNYTSETFFTERLENKGTGTNYGIDLTLEQFLYKGFYYMLTASLYQSKYVDGNGDEWDTKYNRHFVFNLLGGKEWHLKNENIFGINGKLTILGGKRQSPVNYEESLKYQYVIYDESRPFTVQLPTDYYVDISLNYTINRPKCSHSIILQVKNLLMQEDVFGHAFNYKTKSIVPYGLTIIYPYLSYKIQF